MVQIVRCLILMTLFVLPSMLWAGDPIIGCCERRGKCGNVHNGFEAGVCEGFFIGGTYIRGKVCPNPKKPCQDPEGDNPTDQDDSGQIEYACTGLPLNPEGGVLTCCLADTDPSPDILTIPADLGGGTVTFAEFDISYSMAYQQAGEGSYEFILQHFEANAPSVELKGIVTGPNKVYLVEEGVGGGVWDTASGELHGSFTLAISNDVFTPENPLYSFPSVVGSFDQVTGTLVLRSKANVFWPVDAGELLGVVKPPDRTFFEPTKVTVFGGYSYGRSEGDLGDFNWNGFNVAVSGHVTDWLAITGDVSGHFTEIGGLLDLSWYNFSAGPQFIRRTGRIRGFGHALFGVSLVDAGLLGFDIGNETGFSTVIGGGVDVGITERFAVRVFQGDWLRIWDVSGQDLNLGRLSFGVVGRF